MRFRRIQQWPELLHSFIEERRHALFRWGQNDCCLFAADWVKFVTGEDPAPALTLRGTYHGVLGAMREAKARGLSRQGDPFGSLLWPLHSGLTALPVAKAGRGDIVAVRTGRMLALGVCLGLHYAAPGPRGLVFLPRDAVEAAWKV